jgi:hypothetical protein
MCVRYLTLYERLKDGFEDANYGRIGSSVIAGLLSRSFTVSVVTPLEFMRTYMQATPSYKNPTYRTFGTLIKEKGIFTMWRGYTATLLRDAPFSAIYWSLYETIQDFLQQKNEKRKLKQLGIDFAAGATAGSVASILTNPLDVIKTHHQTYFTKSSILTTASQIMKEDGIQGFMRGWIPRVGRVAPVSAIY